MVWMAQFFANAKAGSVDRQRRPFFAWRHGPGRGMSATVSNACSISARMRFRISTLWGSAMNCSGVMVHWSNPCSAYGRTDAGMISVTKLPSEPRHGQRTAGSELAGSHESLFLVLTATPLIEANSVSNHAGFSADPFVHATYSEPPSALGPRAAVSRKRRIQHRGFRITAPMPGRTGSLRWSPRRSARALDRLPRSRRSTPCRSARSA